MKPFKHIRVRLAAWNILVFGGILALYAVGTSWFFLSTLSRQLDESLMEELEMADQMLFPLRPGDYLVDSHPADPKRHERFIELWSPDGQLLYRSKMLGSRTLGGPPDTSEFRGVVRTVVLGDGSRMRVASKLHVASTPLTLLRLAVNEEDYLGTVHRFINVLMVAIPVGLLLVSVSAYWLARNALRPVDLMTSAAQRITAERLNERLRVLNPDDELGRLAGTFNELLGRIEHAFGQLRQFTSDASHQLRTPLTAMRSVGEVALQKSRTPEEYREVISSMLEESTRLTQLVDNLLFLSRADAQKHLLHCERLDALELAHEVAAMMHVLAEEKCQQLNVVGETGIIISADRSLLCHALMNVIDNAIKFSPEAATTIVAVNRQDDSCVISVTDSGPGIPPEAREKIFERFYRIDPNGSAGSGLGLAIASWAVEINNGTITVRPHEPSGSTFLITLPCADPP